MFSKRLKVAKCQKIPSWYVIKISNFSNWFILWINSMRWPQNFAKYPPYFFSMQCQSKVRWRFRKICGLLRINFKGKIWFLNKYTNLKTIAEHFPHCNTKGPNIRGWSEFEKCDTFWGTPSNRQFEIHVEICLIIIFSHS